MKVLLLGAANDIVFSNCGADCVTCLRAALSSRDELFVNKCQRTKEKVRCGKAIKQGTSVLLCSSSADDLNSTKSFKTKLTAFITVEELLKRTKADNETRVACHDNSNTSQPCVAACTQYAGVVCANSARETDG